MEKNIENTDIISSVKLYYDEYECYLFLSLGIVMKVYQLWY